MDPKPEEKLIFTVKTWIETNSKFLGRTDDDFILMFLRSCNFDLELTKKTITSYYQARRSVPEWWKNRNLNDEKLQAIMKLKASVMLISTDVCQPTVGIILLRRMGNDSENFDNYIKFGCMALEVTIRRLNSQFNGCTVIVDCRDYKWWFLLRCLSPIFAKNFINHVYVSKTCGLTPNYFFRQIGYS
ncbi:hypothetical protein CHUAL_002029 [Chamberlinius hualienensis]